MNLKLFLPFFLFGVVYGNRNLHNKDICEEHNENFDLFISCLKLNNYDYNLCEKVYNNLDWEEWTVNNCYFTLHLPRN